MFVSEFVSPSNDLHVGAVGKITCSVARRVVSRHVTRWRTPSGAQKSFFESSAAIMTRENIVNMQRKFLKPVTRLVTSWQLLKSRPTELTCIVRLATAGFLRRRPLLPV